MVDALVLGPARALRLMRAEGGLRQSSGVGCRRVLTAVACSAHDRPCGAQSLVLPPKPGQTGSIRGYPRRSLEPVSRV